jgi:hypothetical protein
MCVFVGIVLRFHPLLFRVKDKYNFYQIIFDTIWGYALSGNFEEYKFPSKILRNI